MTKARRKRTKRQPDESPGAEHRSRWRNLPSGTEGWSFGGMKVERREWSREERRQRLEARERRIYWGKAVSAALAVLIAMAQGYSTAESLATKQAVLERRILNNERDLAEIKSWFSIPAPRNPGR